MKFYMPEVYEVAVYGLEMAKKTAMWGTYGKGGWRHCHGGCPEHKIRWVRLIDCSTEHLQNILGASGDLYQISVLYYNIIASILTDRGADVPERASIFT